MRRRSTAGLLVLVFSLALAACGDDDGGEVRGTEGGSGSEAEEASGSPASGSEAEAEPAFTRDEADSVVEVAGEDFEFVLDTDTVTGPNVYFVFENVGDEIHELEVLDADGEEMGEVADVEPGETADLALELEPGTYTLTCQIEEGGQTHAELGMETTITVE